MQDSGRGGWGPRRHPYVRICMRNVDQPGRPVTAPSMAAARRLDDATTTRGNAAAARLSDKCGRTGIGRADDSGRVLADREAGAEMQRAVRVRAIDTSAQRVTHLSRRAPRRA
jgi:hypothetical protein